MAMEDVKSLIELAYQSYQSQNYADALRLYLRAGLQLVQHDWQFTVGSKIRGLRSSLKIQPLRINPELSTTQ